MLVWFVGSTSSTPNRPKTRAGRVFGVWVWGLIDSLMATILNDKARQKKRINHQKPHRLASHKDIIFASISSHRTCVGGQQQVHSGGMIIGDVAAVSFGAVAGALSRYQIGNFATRIIAEDKRLSHLTGWHTAAINVFGSFILGSMAGLPTFDPSIKQDLKGITPRMRLMAGVGFCGSFTTFSTFSVDVLTMLNEGKVARALAYASVNNFGGVTAAFAGFNIAKLLIKK